MTTTKGKKKYTNWTEGKIKIGNEDCTKSDSMKYSWYLLPEEEAEFTVYSTKECQYCIMALDLLGKMKWVEGRKMVEFLNYSLDVVGLDPYLCGKLSELTGKYQYVPVVFRRGKFIGGYAELKALVDAKGSEYYVG